jgi:hypothetical protein
VTDLRRAARAAKPHPQTVRVPTLSFLRWIALALTAGAIAISGVYLWQMGRAYDRIAGQSQFIRHGRRAHRIRAGWFGHAGARGAWQWRRFRSGGADRQRRDRRRLSLDRAVALRLPALDAACGRDLRNAGRCLCPPAGPPGHPADGGGRAVAGRAFGAVLRAEIPRAGAVAGAAVVRRGVVHRCAASRGEPLGRFAEDDFQVRLRLLGRQYRAAQAAHEAHGCQRRGHRGACSRAAAGRGPGHRLHEPRRTALRRRGAGQSRGHAQRAHCGHSRAHPDFSCHG